MNVLTQSRFAFLLMFVAHLFSSYSGHCQQKDTGLWASVNFDYKIIKKLSASFTEELRLYENMSEVGTLFSDIGLEYKLDKHFRFAMHYRFFQKKSMADNYSFGNRVYADCKYEKKFKPFLFQFRTRFQLSVQDIRRKYNGGIPVCYWRNKLSLKLETKKRYEPYVSLELFTPLNYPRTSAFDNLRATLGVNYKFSKRSSVDLYYMIQQQFNVSLPETEFILGIGYNFKL